MNEKENQRRIFRHSNSSGFFEGTPPRCNTLHSPNSKNVSYHHFLDMPLTSNTESMSSINDYSLDPTLSNESLYEEALSFDRSHNISDDEDISYDTESSDSETKRRTMVLDVSSCYSFIAEKNAEAMKREVDLLLSSQKGVLNVLDDNSTLDIYAYSENDDERSIITPVDMDLQSMLSMNQESPYFISPHYHVSLSPGRDLSDVHGYEHHPDSHIKRFRTSKRIKNLARQAYISPKSSLSRIRTKDCFKDFPLAHKKLESGNKRTRPSSTEKQIIKHLNSTTLFLPAYSLAMTILALLFAYAYFSLRSKDRGLTMPPSYVVYVDMTPAITFSRSLLENDTCSPTLIFHVQPRLQE